MTNEQIVLINDREWIDMPRGQFTKDGLVYKIAKLKNFCNRCVYMTNSRGVNVKICNGFDNIISTKRHFEDLYQKTGMNSDKVLKFIESK